jgi:hypothetical protein
VAKFADLFIPEAHREIVFGFVRGNVCSKNEIGLKATGNGMIAITNWHLLAEGDVAENIEEVETLGAPLDPQAVVAGVLPLTPGRATGNSLEVLDRRYARGNVLDFLAQLPELMVFNDEAHHIHEFKREGETTEVEWQKSLTRIAEAKGRRFVQVDFSATPYNDVGAGKNKRKVYFPHIITDFDLKSAMRAGLVKSLVLDRRKEIGALPLEFKAERDDSGNPSLSEGQRVMLRAGLVKLRKLEADFAKIDPHRYLSRLTRRISQALSEPLPKGNKIATHLAKPYLQVNTAELTGWIDDYVWTQLFAGTFNPLEDENWRLLLLQPVVDHITKVFAVGLLESEEMHTTGETEVHLRRLSEVPKLMVRESASVEVSKCIYERLGWPSRNGGLERAFIYWAQADSLVQAFCKISENRHTYARLRYVKDDGLPAFYSPDFLVRTENAVYLVETKGQEQTIHPNVQRKLKAALAWCERINNLTEEQRGGPLALCAAG